MQSKRYTEAQNRTYFNKNPFTSRSHKTNIIGFTLIVTGFAITLSVDLSSAANIGLTQTIWVLAGLVVAGILCIILIYRFNESMYEKLEANRQLTIFNSCIANIESKFKTIIGQHNENTLFLLYKKGDVRQLKKNFGNLTENQKSDDIKLVYKKITEAKTAQSIVNITKKYVKKSNTRN